MSTDDNRKPAAHETLSEIADRLNALGAKGGTGERILPYSSRLSWAHTTAATPEPAAPSEFPKPLQQTADAPPPDMMSTDAQQSQPTDPTSEPPGAPHNPAPTSASSSGRNEAPAPTPLVLGRPEPPRLRTALLTYFPMLIAVMSLGMSIFQGLLFERSIELSQRSIDLLERNVARGEYIRTCREAIETYFQVKQKVSVLMPAADRSNVVGASRVTEASRLDAQAAIAKFGGLGTYLANFQDPGTRARYTELTRTLTGIFENARTTPLAEIDKTFEPADKLFTSMNDDCVRLARTMRL